MYIAVTMWTGPTRIWPAPPHILTTG